MRHPFLYALQGSVVLGKVYRQSTVVIFIFFFQHEQRYDFWLTGLLSQLQHNPMFVTKKKEEIQNENVQVFL